MSLSDHVGWGIGLGIGLNIGQLVVTGFVTSLAHDDIKAAVIGFGAFGLIQLVYVIPIYFYLRRREREETAKGLVIVAAIVMLINVTCWIGFR